MVLCESYCCGSVSSGANLPSVLPRRRVFISKRLAWVLRHGAHKVGLTLTKGGYLYVDDVLQTPSFHGVTLEDIRQVVDSDDKTRSELWPSPESGRLRVRAFQGHRLPIEDMDLTPITDPSHYPVVVHGTYIRNWERIRVEGLKRMSRTHIHFAPGEPGEADVISGMRSNAELVIHIDLAKALHDGFKFYLSQNRVILTEGDSQGCLPPAYFTAVYQRNPQACLLIQGALCSSAEAVLKVSLPH
ncbi:unnamed protein product [Dicrocoelium dendriticum]|nr:unnamed protein product [Dicrocoelium dendriticum]